MYKKERQDNLITRFLHLLNNIAIVVVDFHSA